MTGDPRFECKECAHGIFSLIVTNENYSLEQNNNIPALKFTVFRTKL